MDFFLKELLIFVIVFVFSPVRGTKLNVPRVLLPVFNSDISTQFTLETESGCYKWSTTRSDIINLTPIEENKERQCSSKAIVQTITKEAARNIAVVLAEDVATKHNLRCDVIVDAIHSLQISTTTRELFMEEAPEDFEVKAYDDQGNEFSTLEGIEFEWNIVSLGPNKDTVLRYITFGDSPYETPKAIEALEAQQKKGYSILLEGVKSGSAKVSVRLPYPEYKDIQANEVQLMVVANLLLTPAEVYVMPGDVVSFRIYMINNGRMEEITLPDSQYYIEAEDMEIASSVKKTGNVTALKEGKTRIILRDRNIGKDDPLMKFPAATIYVSIPDYLLINILPDKNFAILVGDNHDLVAEVYSSTNHKLYLGDGVQIVFEVGPEFQVSSRSFNGSWLTGYGVKPSVVNVKATLESVYSEKFGITKLEKPISSRVDLVIYPRITIEPSEVILPWDPIIRPKYDITLVAKGGDNRFIWTSSDHSIGIVSQAGHVRTHSEGFFEVSAVMMRNHHNRQSAKFLILPPARLEIVEFVMEAEIGSPVYLHIALYAEHKTDEGKTIQIPFTECQEVPFQVKQSDIKFRHNKTSMLPPIGISCGNIAMVGLNIGTSKVTVTYYQDGRALEDSVTISAYKPLELIEPTREIILAVGSSINLLFYGGPRPVAGRPSDHQRVLVSEDEDIAQAKDITEYHSVPGQDITVVEVLCRKLGETDIKLMISNTPSAANCKSQSASIITRVTCGKPRRISLQPQLKVSDADACPMDLTSGSVVVQSSKPIDIDVTVFDDCGNKFLNISSLNFAWLLSPQSAGKLQSKNSVFPRNTTVGTVDIASRAYQTFVADIEVGSALINVTVIGYNSVVLKANRISPEWPEFTTQEDKGAQVPPITASIALFLVDDATVTPSEITLYNHPGNKKIVPVQHGSGFFELALSATDIADVRYQEGARELTITPLRSGELMIQLQDLCLAVKPTTITVHVVSVSIIRVEMVDKVEVGKCISCIVRLYDENDNLMVIPEPNMLDLRPEFENKIANIIRMEEDPAKPWNAGEIHFVVTGIEVGDTKLIFSSANNDDEVNSAPIDLQVFSPLKLFPRNGTLLIGASIQLTIRGGPQPDANVVFTIANPKIADVNDKGVIRGKSLGKSKILAQSVGIHPNTGASIIYSEDTVELDVISLTGVKIAAPLTRFSVGSTVPFWCFGVPDISPLVLGSFDDPPLIFKWIVDDKLLADLTGVFHHVGVNIQKPDRVVLKLTGLQAGATRVFVNVTVPGVTLNLPNLNTVMLSHFVDIEIVDKFSLLYPSNIPGSPLLMAPFSQIQLETNFPGSKLDYALPGDQAPSTELLVDKSVLVADEVVTVSPDGLLRSYGTLGHAMLIVTSTDQMGLKQRLTIVVQVKPIHYMNLNIVANWRVSSSHPVSTIPLGTEFKLKATYHDNIGNIFNAGPTELKVTTSRCDLLRILPVTDDGSIMIYTRKPGLTVLKAWADGIQKTADYVKINVEQSVKPMLDHLTSGDTVCLWTPVVNEYNIPGHWKSSDSAMVDINPALDIGFVGDKEGTVILTHSLLLSAPIHIPVYAVSEIEFLEPDPNLVLTNGEENSVIRFVLVLQSEKSSGLKTNNLIQGWRCRADVRKLVRPQGFRCFMELSNTTSPIAVDEIFNITNSWVPETGQYACKLINLGLKGPEVSVLRTNLTLWAVTENSNIMSPRMSILFMPSVFAPDQVYLQEQSIGGELILIGLSEVLDQVKVEPADSSILYVDGGKMIDDRTKRYEVQLIDYHWRLADMEDAMGLIMSSPITKQEKKIIVKVTGNISGQLCGAANSPLLRFLQTYKYAMMMATGMILIFVLTFYFYSNYMQPIVNVNVNPAAMGPGATVLGNRCASNCAANVSLNSRSMHMSPSFRTSTNAQTSALNMSRNQSSSTTAANCTCCGGRNNSHNASREPVYGDATSFYTSSPEVRRNRRLM